MHSRWLDQDTSDDLALRTYTARLLGAEPELVLHGGGNTSVKGKARDLFGEEVDALFVKASGQDLATITPGGHVACDLGRLRRCRALPEAGDEHLARLLRSCLLDPAAPTPSIEAPVHALLPARFVDHTHADAILALTNREDGLEVVARALGSDVILLPYVFPGLDLARATIEAYEALPNALGMVWFRHGLLTWGETARESYERTIELVSRAEEFLVQARRHRLKVVHGKGAGSAAPPGPPPPTNVVTIVQGSLALQAEQGRDGDEEEPPSPRERIRLDEERKRELLLEHRREIAERAGAALLLRGALARPTADADRPFLRPILAGATDVHTRELLAWGGARELFSSPPLTSDHLIRTGRQPLWWQEVEGEEEEATRERLRAELARFAAEEGPVGDEVPRVVLAPGHGAFCLGWTPREAAITRDITTHTLAVKVAIAGSGGRYEGLSPDHLAVMRTRGMQQAKVLRAPAPLAGSIALVTGAAGAIGSGVVRTLAAAGAAVALTDLAGEALDGLAEELAAEFPEQILAVPMDVTDPEEVAAAFATVAATWGGVDLVVVNAGVAHVAPIADLDLEVFRRLERVNVEGTLLVLAEAARLFRRQGIGGDVVLVSSKNVFAPGASFGAYSATKAAAHQLARIASLELAPLGVRVNMVTPDAVFGERERPSGLWAEVGPERMKARGLDAEELEAYYQSRNLLKAKVTARHVGEAVLFFAQRKTPTTGATLPVDGGLPEATPR